MHVRPMWCADGSLTMEEKRIMHLGTLYQPFHSTDDIGFSRKSSRVLDIIRQDQDVL